MADITNTWRFQRILVEAAQFRTMRQIIDADPKIGRRPPGYCADACVSPRRCCCIGPT
jgi:hypothetical protein